MSALTVIGYGADESAGIVVMHRCVRSIDIRRLECEVGIANERETIAAAIIVNVRGELDRPDLRLVEATSIDLAWPNLLAVCGSRGEQPDQLRQPVIALGGRAAPADGGTLEDLLGGGIAHAAGELVALRRLALAGLDVGSHGRHSAPPRRRPRLHNTRRWPRFRRLRGTFLRPDRRQRAGQHGADPEIDHPALDLGREIRIGEAGHAPADQRRGSELAPGRGRGVAKHGD
jgi:hypothetical protein